MPKTTAKRKSKSKSKSRPITVKIARRSFGQRAIPVVIAAVLVAILGVQQLLLTHAATFDVQSYLGQFTPGTAHEAIPHGVPSYYDWYANSKLYSITPPTGDSGYINFWGQVYVDTTDIRPSNTRVEISNCHLWTLMNGASSWTLAADGSGAALEGGQWKEDFSGVVNSNINFRTESDGGQSVVTVEGANAHFWPNKPLYNVGSNMKAEVVTCNTRLILANPSGTDDRSNSHYIMSVGSDWRRSDYSCPYVGSVQVCNPVLQGKFIKITNNWRTVVGSTMSSAQLSSYPALPTSAFVQPDGTYPDGSAVNQTTPPPSTGGSGTTTGSGGTTTGSGGTTTPTTVSYTPCGSATSTTNLALNRPVAVSSVQNGSSYVGCKAVDGSSVFGASNVDDSRWSSVPSDPQWLTVDLGSSKAIGGVSINWEYASAKAYQIQVSNDDSSWKTVASETNNGTGSTAANPTAGLKAYAFSANARYVRVYGTARTTTYGYSIVELTVAPPDAAPTPTPPPTSTGGGTSTSGGGSTGASSGSGTVTVGGSGTTPSLPQPSGSTNPITISVPGGGSVSVPAGAVPKISGKVTFNNPVAAGSSAVKTTISVDNKQLAAAQGSGVSLDSSYLPNGAHSIVLKSDSASGKTTTTGRIVVVQNHLNPLQQVRNRLFVLFGGNKLAANTTTGLGVVIVLFGVSFAVFKLSPLIHFRRPKQLTYWQ